MNTEKETPTKKVAAPSVAQINAEYVTQVIHYYYLHYLCLSSLPIKTA